MSNRNSSKPSLFELAASAWQPVDSVAVALCLVIPCLVWIGRHILLVGARDYSVTLSAVAQYLVDVHALGLVSLLSVVVLPGAATIHRHRRRRLFMSIASLMGVLIMIVYAVVCVPPAMTTIHRLG